MANLRFRWFFYSVIAGRSSQFRWNQSARFGYRDFVMTANWRLQGVQRPFLIGSGIKDITPREQLEECLSAIAIREPTVRAFAYIDIEGARVAADRATERRLAGRSISPIDGMVVGIKDIIETAAMPTGMGSPLYDGWRSGRDAASVAALKEAGAIILGKTVTTEFAATEPGSTRNPWDSRRTPGGCSSGSAAAVAAGFVNAALGTQVLGSIMRPASFCGCFGFKPSVGGLNRGGSHDAFSQSCTGVLAASLEDLWQVAYEIVIRAGGDPGYPGLSGPPRAPVAKKPSRLIFLETAGWAGASPEGKSKFEQAIADLRQAGIEILTRADHPDIEAVEASIAPSITVSNLINDWEGRWPLNTYRDRDIDKLSRHMRERLERAEAMSLTDARAALSQRSEIRRQYTKLAALCDACITLSASGPAPLGLESTGSPVFAAPASLLGAPAISIPYFTVESLPLGFQLVAAVGADANLFANAAALCELIANS